MATAVKAEDEVLQTALVKYHKELLSSNEKISARLKAEHGIQMRYVYS